MNTEFNNFALTDFKRRQCVYYIEIGFLLTFAYISFLDLKFSLAVGAGAFLGCLRHQPRVSAIHTSGATFR